jgi:hypothetical protein
MKKIFLISSIALGVLLFFLAIYNFVFRNNPYDPKAEKDGIEVKNTEDVADASQKPADAEETVTAVTQEKTVSPVFRKETDSILYFSPQDVSLKEVSLADWSPRTVMELAGVPLQAVWSPDASKVLVETNDGKEKRWHLIHVDSRADALLKSGLENPAWTNLGDKIVYKYYDVATQERSLNVANPDGSDWRKIADVPFKKMRMAAMPKTSLIAFWNEGDAFDETSLRSIPATGGEASVILSGRFGGDYRFSPDGDSIAASFSTEKGGSGLMLALLNEKGGEFRNLAIPTLASKIVWSEDGQTIYYALPGALADGAVLPNDYYARPMLTRDTFWKVDTSTVKSERIVEPQSLEQGYDAFQPFLDEDEKYFFFVNRIDGKLYRIRL